MEHYTSSIWESIYHYGSYTSFYGALFIYIGALFSLVERIIYLLLKDYYTFKTMAEVSLVFFPAFTHPRPGKHYNTYFFSLLFPPLVSSLSSLLTLPTLFFGGSIYDYCNVNQVSHWWWFRE